MLPFSEKESAHGIFIRKFSVDLEDDDLYWHRDREDRIISRVAGDDWFFQEDNCLPVPISSTPIFIRKGTWHRIIKGSSDLTIEVIKRDQIK